MDQMLYFRPHNRLRGFDNLYLVGGGTHPGSGLPTVFESGRISSNLLCDAAGVYYERADLASAILAKG
jgi:phytoene desaturase